MSDTTRLIAQLGPWRERPGARFERLADALGAVIERGGLDGIALPAERRLADGLGVSRSTVVRAYELLRERRLVVSRERSATVVRSVGRRGPAPATELPQLGQLLAGAPASPIDLAVAAPRLDALVAGVGASLGDAAALVPAHGYDPQGLLALRETIARRLSSDGTPAAADEILVTNGAHEALSLIVALFVGRGQPVAVDAPTYPGALELFERAGATPVAVAGDAAGMRPDALRALLSRAVVALVYLMPGCASPTGASIALGRRPALLAAAREHDTLVVEDAALDKLRLDGPLPSLRALAPERVLRVGSLDKLAWAGLRIGWICGPRELIGRLARMKAARDLGNGVLGQLAALALLRDVDGLRAARVAQARERSALLRAELARLIPAWRIAAPEGGWSLWAEWGEGGIVSRAVDDAVAAGGGRAGSSLAGDGDGAAGGGPGGRPSPMIDGDALAAAAARHGVHIAAGRPHFPAAGTERSAPSVTAVRIAYAAEPAALIEGAARLTAAWAELAGSAP